LRIAVQGCRFGCGRQSSHSPTKSLQTVPDWSHPHNSLLSVRRFGYLLFDLASSVILVDSDGLTDTAMIVIWLLLLDGSIGSLEKEVQDHQEQYNECGTARPTK
jgi:hypothetical protein